MFIGSRYKRKYCDNTIYIIFILENLYRPGLYLVVEIEEGDSILDLGLGEVTVGPLCSSLITCPTELNLLIFVICGPTNQRV